jgi:hypothetical protein
MKTYKVKATYTVYCQTEIEAEDEDQAYEIAREMDGGLFERAGDDDLADWRIYDISEVEE